MVTPVVKKVRRKKVAEKKPSAEQKAKEKKPIEQKNLVAQAIQKMQLANEMQMKLLRDEIKKINLSASQPPVEWVFDIIRDETGLIRQIKASAPKTKRTLN